MVEDANHMGRLVVISSFGKKKDVLRVSTVTIFRPLWVLVLTWIRTVGILGKQRRS